MFFEDIQMFWTHTSSGDQSFGAGSSVQREVNELGVEVGGREGGERDVEENFPQWIIVGQL